MKNRRNKIKREADAVILMKLFKLFAKNNGNTIIICILMSIFSGIHPYVMIIATSILIDGLVNGLGFAVLLKYAVIGILVNNAVSMLANYLREAFNARVENCMERQNMDLNERSMAIDYEYLEDPAVQEKKRKQEQLVAMNGGLYWMIIWPLDRGLTNLINVITAVVVVIPMFLTSLSGKGILVREMTEGSYAFFSSGWFTLAFLAVVAVSIFICYRNEIVKNKKGNAEFEKYNECNKLSEYFLNNILASSSTAKDLRIFNQEELIDRGIHGRLDESRGILKKIRSIWVRQRCVGENCTFVCGAVSYIFAAVKAYMGLISIGNVVRYANSIISCVGAVAEVLFTLSQWQEATEYGRDYLDYIELKSKKEKEGELVKQSKNGYFTVEFDNVSFKYPGSSEYVIKNLNVQLNVGQKTAIVGRNGSGKTTFIKLLCRLYDVTEGTIRVNGTDIRKYSYEEYLKLFSVVFQDYRMFSYKIGENIASNENYDAGRVYDALMRAGLQERIERMDKGLETYVGKEFDENGISISGGECQKMAIARAIYKDAPFVVMDEPTAALDPVSECEVYSGFDGMVGRKTAIYISHRLASCRFCDDIIVFDRGTVIQRGSHDELLNQQGLYKQMWTAQAQYYEG